MKTNYILLALGWLLNLTQVHAQSNAPSSLNGSAGAHNQVNLTWKDNSTNESKFEIEREGFSGFTKIGEAGVNATMYQDKTVQANGSYTYRVRAVLVTGAATLYSNSATVTTPQEPPGAPTGLNAAAQGSNSIKLTWSNGSGGTPTDYQVERGTSSGGPFTVLQTVAYSRTPTFTDGGASPGQPYCYRVRARNGGGTSDYSAAACATPSLAPTNVKNFKATAVNSNSIRLTWDRYGKESSISIERRTGQNGSWARVASTLADGGEYIDNGLSAGTEYCYRIAEDGQEYSAVACTTTQQSAPNAPARLQIQAVSSSQINLQWADVSDNETGFQIERAISATAPFARIADVGQNTTNYSDPNLQASTQYCYRVLAVNGVGASGYTEIQCATTQNPPLGAPQNLVATAASTTQINLTWTGLSGATSYQLERSPNGTDGWTKIADPAGNATSYNDQGLTPNTRYYYRIRAVVSGTTVVPEPYSNVANALTPDAPPAAPARLSATAASYNQINLQWADLSGNEAGFELERSLNGTDGWTKVADIGANATTYSDPNLQPLTRYFYRIRAVNAAGQSAYSNLADATTPVGPPAAPQNLVATAASTTQINVSWNANVTNATGVQVERSPNGNDGWTKIADLPGTAVSYEDKGLAQNTRYYYRIRAVNATGTGPYSNVANALTPDAPPVAPARLSATAASATQIGLSWADLSTNEAGFDIERSPDGTVWAKVGDAPANATSFQNTGLTPNTRYYYRIRAVNAAGQSAYSNTADATTPDIAPNAPARLMATPTSAVVITLNWADQSGNETGFEIERGNSETGTFARIADVGPNVTSYEDRGLTPAVPYCYRVRAKNAIGLSPYSNVACASTPDVPPAAPSRLTATPASPTQINLAWTDGSTNETGFELERAAGATAPFAKIADLPANATTYQDKGLTDNTPYCYRIRARNAAGTSANTETACATTPLAPPASPTNLTAQLFDYDQIKLNWPALPASAVTVIIERSTNPSSGFAEIKQQPAAQVGFVDMGLQEFTTYYYRIRAVNPAGNSGYSNVATVSVQEVVIAVEDEITTHTTVSVSQRTLHVVTDWYSPLQTTVHLLTPSGQAVLADRRTVKPTDRWSYNLDTLPAGLFIIQIIADGRRLAKRIVLP